MNVTKFAYLLAIGLALSFTTGCKKSPYGVTPIPGRTGNVGDEGAGKAVGEGSETSGGVTATPAANPADWAGATRDEKKFEADTVRFEYDSSVVRSSEKSKVANVADYLKTTPGTGVEIQGNCDERGTDEYNRALGERRALAVREVMVSMGVDGGRILTVSFGRSRPVDTGHSDASHARNRRADFVLLTK
jgi:peptidoglycan-associated lipoprotein